MCTINIKKNPLKKLKTCFTINYLQNKKSFDNLLKHSQVIINPNSNNFFKRMEEMMRMNGRLLRKIFNKRIEEIMQKYSKRGLQIEQEANFFGIESHGIMQIRGNGILLLTNTDLVFGLFRPVRDFVIPLAKIEKIELVESHLTKTVFQPLLKVYFINEEGAMDSMALWVVNPAKWKDLLEKSVKS